MFEEVGFTGLVKVVELEDLDITKPSGEGLESALHFYLLLSPPIDMCTPTRISEVSPLFSRYFLRKLKLVHNKRTGESVRDTRSLTILNWYF
jgi:hypothetical protein